MSLVLDSSLALSWYFKDETTKASDSVLDLVVELGAVAPSLWRYEVANVLQLAVRRKRIEPSYRDACLTELASLAVVIDPMSDMQVWTAIVRMSDLHGLTVYDAAYLELAMRRHLPVASLDRALLKAAVAEGIATLGL